MAQLDRAQSGMKLGELSQRLMVSNGNITGLVDRLLEQGLIDRQAAPNDRRAQLVKLTPEGRRMFRSMAAAHENWVAEVFAELTPSEIESLMRLLGKAKNSARKAVQRGAGE
jgi:DNA-binding MarR family transcriptional regulator